MRKFIIDTDTASDDAAALVMAALDRDVEILGVTAVAGNVGVGQAALNALMTLQVCGCDAPVYPGASRPLFRERSQTLPVHGNDGMGDCGIIHPAGAPVQRRAVEFILDTVRQYPDEVEIVALGPATNIALAILTDRDAMRRVRHIWSMGTSGFGAGNATPVSEFNVFIDAEAYAVMLGCGAPITVAGLDLCTGGVALDKAALAALAGGNDVGKFLERATSQLLQYNLRAFGRHAVDLPDAVAMAAAIWGDCVKKSLPCRCVCCTARNETYGQVILYRDGFTYESMPAVMGGRADVIVELDENLFVQRLMKLLV